MIEDPIAAAIAAAFAKRQALGDLQGPRQCVGWDSGRGCAWSTCGLCIHRTNSIAYCEGETE